MPLPKGVELERKVHEYFLGKGYFVKPHITVALDYFEDEQIITDIDIFGVKIDDDLYLKKLCVDCKHEQKGFAQIIRLIGLSKIAGFEECFAVRERITKEVRHFGNSIGIKLLQKDFFDKQKNLIQEGSCTVKTYEKNQQFLSILREQENRELKRKFLFPTQRTILERDSFRRFKAIRLIVNDLLRELEMVNTKQEELLHWILFDAYSIAILSLIEIAISLQDCPNKYLKIEVDSRLKEGYFSEKTKKEIIAYLKEFDKKLRETRLLKLPDTRINFETSPSFLDPLTDLMNVLLQNKNLFQKILLVNDFLIYGYILHKEAPIKSKITKQTRTNEEELKIISKINSLVVETLCDNKKDISRFNVYF